MSVGFHRVTDAYRRHGPVDLARVGITAARYRVEDEFWSTRGARSVTIGDVSASFTTSTVGESRMVRNLPSMESEMLGDLLSELRAEDVYYDVGGHMGLFACLAAERTTDGTVATFEPFPPMRKLLRENVRRNDADVTVFDVALSNETGQATLDNPFKQQADWSGTASLDPNSEDGITVETVVGDDLVAQTEVAAPTVVKIDVEGAEPLVIEGLRETLAREECRLVYCEVHEPTETRRSTVDYGTDPDEVLTMLDDLGFDVEILTDRGNDRHVKAVRR
ncbi:FkbM family methyltransferase [Haloarchaeobius sp. DFWS5]|uniref:FkbM family methyltransferase n=1 Tax=Haloarchaeobius sp. DFWS5 TaxID=3446114 RepID=UPI003EC0D676